MSRTRLNRFGSQARRRFLRQAALLSAAPLLGRISGVQAEDSLHYPMPFGNGDRDLVRYPQKRPLIRLTTRPPQLETPFAVFDEDLLTPNDAFFVRYHLSGIPLRIDLESYRLRLGGFVERPLELSLSELKSLGPVKEIVAVNQCSGNSRGFITPRVAGGQLGHGAMGNARWTGIGLKTLLDKAGVRSGAKEVSFDGLDQPPMPATPDFVKALRIEHALDGNVMLAWAMNGEDLPLLNGYPLRLIVPGYYGTYWVKHLSAITVLDHSYDGFFMSTAYRVPDNDCACTEPGMKAARTRPIERLSVRSFITNLPDGQRIAYGHPLTLRGIAFDGGYGIRQVDVSDDGGGSWQPATLGPDHGSYAFRPWTLSYAPRRKGSFQFKVRATNQAGETQPLQARWNPAGYRYNAIESYRVVVA